MLIIVAVIVSTFAATEVFSFSSAPVAAKKPFYVGVTYCGDNVSEAEQLINKVKGYTNLFVAQSGPLMSNLTEMIQICEYAVNSGLSIIVYYSHNGDNTNQCDPLLAMAPAQWGSHFLGLYYDDEPGGKMLDDSVSFRFNENETSISKAADGTISVVSSPDPYSSSGSYFLSFHPSGEIDVSRSSFSNQTVNGVNNVTFTVTNNKNINYYPNGTITSQLSIFSSYSNGTYVSISQDPITCEQNGTVMSGNETIRTGEGILLWSPLGDEDANITITQQPITDPGSISQFEPYQQLWDSRPLQTAAEVARDYVDTEMNILSTIGNQSDVQLFTADYALESYDYQAGYNVVLGELGWNQSVTQDIDQIRGAADMAGASWGTMVAWNSLTPPYLMMGDQMYNAMKQSYESGAEYVVVFNYQGSPQSNQQPGTQVNQQPQGGSVNSTAPTINGLLQDDQFAAIQKFWNNIVENPKETNNFKAKDALVLPLNFGGGMRNKDDGTWGIWKPDSTTQQVWSTLQSSLAKYGSKLDIVYDDPAYSTAGHYQHVVYWSQTA